MPKSKVDKIIDLVVTLTKDELKELQDRLWVEHSVGSIFHVPVTKIGGTFTDGYWLKEAEKEK